MVSAYIMSVLSHVHVCLFNTLLAMCPTRSAPHNLSSNEDCTVIVRSMVGVMCIVLVLYSYIYLSLLYHHSKSVKDTLDEYE